MFRLHAQLLTILCVLVIVLSLVSETSTSQATKHSLSLNGTSSYVSVPNSSTINISGPITVEAWIKLNSINGNYQDIVCREAWGQAGTGGGYEFAITNTGKLRLDLYQSHNQYTTAIGSTTVTTNTWHHVAGVFDGSQIRVYLDGVLDGSLSTTSGPASGTSALNIGKSTYTTYYFGGLIDEVRISAAALYNSNFTPELGPASNTRALWKFDGQTTNDSSGNGNHGTLQSGANYSTVVPFTGGSQRPVPVAGGPYAGQAGQTINFTSSGSFDPDGTISSYHWNFGDGTSANTQNPSHSYETSGLFTATLTVTDNAGLRASATAAVTIGGSSEARLDPMNETGGGGDNPLSRNFNWTQDLLNLPGRSGMDLNLALSYNSLVWTKNGSIISFDDDRGFPSAGFRLGFPVIQPRHLNPETGKNGYLLIGSDGSRTELRQLSSSQTLFESADSSHILLDASFSLPAPNNDKLVLRTTDGMRMLYALKGVDYQCTEIKDRNGNYITINYTVAGKIDTIIDTLNREIKFNYYANGLLEKITQVWKKGKANERTHIWAYFEYTGKEIQTAFTDLTVVGAANGSEPKLLTKVTLADNSTTISNNSRVEFNYTSWGQVHKVSNLAPDGHILNYRSYNLPLTSSPAQTDCPRFTERRDWAENWNRGGGLGASGLPAGTEQEVLTTYAIPNIENDDEWTMPDGTPQSGTRTQVTVADGTSDEVTNEIHYIGKKNNPDGWQRKLPALVNTYDQDNVLRRQVMTKWTQDVTDISYELNPRIEETNIYDPSGLRKRTKIIYELATLPDNTTCQLPKDFIEYAADASTVLRSTRTEYEDDNAYLTRRIIGLVSKKSLYAGDVNGSGYTLMSQVEFLYDGENSIEGSELPVQHDNSAYSNTFVIGRANVTTLKRYDVTDTSKFTSTTNKYNRAGSLTSSKNKLNHEVTFSYTDAFASVGNTLDAERTFSTYAYPTTVNDPDEFSTRTRYDYDFGSKTWEQTPPPNDLTNVSGPQRTYTYDEMGRLERTTSLVNNAFTRYKYGSNYIETFSSVNSTAETANEGRLLEVFDGLGRVIATAHDHPGHTGHSGAKLVLYDRLGRAIKRSNPTETDISIAGTPINPYQFTALGDDTVAGGGFGWKYTIQTFDWKGRPLVTTNTDGTTTEASYSSCGCAGSLVTTVSDEGTLVGGVIKRRQKKIYADVLDRTIKTESLDWDGNVYATTVNSYDVRDQVTQVRQYEGSQGGYQDTTFEYDGFGRLQTRHLPQQQADPNNQNTSDHTTWTYNDDDTVNTIKDARGAVTAYGYAGTKRGLLKSVTYTQPGSEISITYTYDAAGNRKKMFDPLGSTEYTYDSLSRLQSESREIIDSGFSGSGSYALTYGYNLADELTSITDPFQASINYSYNSATGHLTGVTGSSFQGVTEYLSQMSYRAWGGLKSSVVGTTSSNRQVSQKYNERLQVTEFKLIQGLNIVLGKQYTYGNATTGNNDGRVKYTKDLRAEQLDRGYQYDHRGRITFAKSGIEARRVIDPANTLNRPLMDGPYDQAFGYDAFDHMNNRTWRYFFTHYTGATMPGNAGSAATYTNNRKQGWLYDSEGNVTQPGSDTTWQYTYNAAGQIVNSTVPGRTTLYGYDGDGRLLKETINGTRTYYLTSSLLGGQTVTELTSAGQKKATYVYQGQQILAKQEGTKVLWLQSDPAGGSRVWIDQSGSITDRIELDALGSQTGNSGYIFYSWEEAFGTGIYNYYQFQQQQYYSLMAGSPGSTVADSVNNAYRSCTLDGGTVPCEVAMGMANRGGATINWRNPGNGLHELYREGILEPIIDKWTSPLPNMWRPDLPPYGPTPPYSFSYISGYRFRTSPDLAATQRPPQKPLDPGQMQSLLTGDCVHFLNSILAELGNQQRPYSNNFPSIFRKAGKRLFTRQMTDEEKKHAWAGTFSVVDDPAYYTFIDEGQYNWGEYHGGYILIHELIHAAGSSVPYNHTQMANAAYNAAKSNPTLWKELVRHGVKEPKVVDYSSSEKMVKADDWFNASVFDSIVKSACPKPPQ